MNEKEQIREIIDRGFKAFKQAEKINELLKEDWAEEDSLKLDKDKRVDV